MNNISSPPPGWRSVPFWSIARRVDRRGRQDAELLSVYRDHGVVPKRSRDDNFNQPSEDLSSYLYVEPGDLVLNKMKTWQGSLAVSRHEGIVSPAYFVCQLAPTVEPRFIHYLLRSAPYIAEYAARSKGIRPNQWDLPFDELRTLPVLLPPLEEQRRIANYLDDQTTRIDQTIQLRHQQMALIKEWAASQLAAGVDQLAEGHGWVSLRRHVTSIEQGWSPDCEAVQAVDDEWGVVKVGAVYGGEFRPYENKRLPSGVEVRRRYEIRSGDLLVTRANTPERVGEACVVPARVRPKLLLCDKIYRLKTSRHVVPDFVAAIARSHQARAYMSSLSSGTSGSMVNIRGEDVLGLQIPRCSTGHQLAFVDATRVRDAQVSNLLTTLEESIEVLSELRRSVITHVVSGEYQVER